MNARSTTRGSRMKDGCKDPHIPRQDQSREQKIFTNRLTQEGSYIKDENKSTSLSGSQVVIIHDIFASYWLY